MSLVIDASVALKWVFEEPGTDAAFALRQEQLVAPALWLAEAANALWRHVRLGEITAEEAFARMTQLTQAPVTPVPIERHVQRALEIATELRHPVYDCVYLAVALQRGEEFVTDDRRFAIAVAARPEWAERVRILPN